jgi:hypothetical protein
MDHPVQQHLPQDRRQALAWGGPHPIENAAPPRGGSQKNKQKLLKKGYVKKKILVLDKLQQEGKYVTRKKKIMG